MSFNFNGILPESIIFTDKGVTTALDKLIFNGVTVWENWKTVTGANFLPISSGSSFNTPITSSGSSFNFKNPTFSCSGRLNNGDSFPREGKVMIEAYNVSSGWVTLYTHQTADIPAEDYRTFNFTFTDSSGALYNQWRVTKTNGSNTWIVDGKITSYTYKP